MEKTVKDPALVEKLSIKQTELTKSALDVPERFSRFNKSFRTTILCRGSG